MNISLSFPDMSDDTLKKKARMEFADSDTHMIHFIKDLMQHKLLFRWCSQNGFDNLAFTKLYLYAVGKAKNNPRAPVDIVFKARESIQPATWYVPYGKPLPSPIAYHCVCECSDLMTRASVARLLLFERRYKTHDGQTVQHNKDRAKLADIARECHIERMDLYSLIVYSRKAKPGTSRWRRFPSADMMRALEKYVPIDSWFIFPEELDDDKVKQMFVNWPPEDVLASK